MINIKREFTGYLRAKVNTFLWNSAVITNIYIYHIIYIYIYHII